MKTYGEIVIDGREYIVIEKKYLAMLEEMEDMEDLRQFHAEGSVSRPLGEFIAEKGNFIKEFRKRKNLKQSELAELLGVTQSHVSRWEGGEIHPTTANIFALAKALNCEVTDLFPGA